MKPLSSAIAILFAGSFLMYLLGVLLFDHANPQLWPLIAQRVYLVFVGIFFVLAVWEYFLLKKKLP